jgi:hypothetical protein
MLSRQAALTKEIALFQDSDDCFLSLLRDDCELDFTFFDIKTAFAVSPWTKTGC